MKISIKVKPGSKQDLVAPTGENSYTVRVKAKALEGKANAAVVRLLSEYFDIPCGNIEVIKGFKARDKIVDIFGLYVKIKK